MLISMSFFYTHAIVLNDYHMPNFLVKTIKQECKINLIQLPIIQLFCVCTCVVMHIDLHIDLYIPFSVEPTTLC